MSFEERMEFLMQSIESHDRQLGELAERMDMTDARLSALADRLDTLAITVSRLTETAQLSFDRLTTAMLGLTEHVVDHQRRIEKLER